MAYTHSKYEVILARGADLNSVADVTGAHWSPGYVPHRVRAVALAIDNAIGGAGVLKFDKRPTHGSDTDRGDGDVAVLTIPNSTAGGIVLYKDGLNVLINPGEQVVAEVTDATAASDTGTVIIYVEPVWERPGNNTSMLASA
jgi:hypothetical protein